jgi:hypothetical protein
MYRAQGVDDNGRPARKQRVLTCRTGTESLRPMVARSGIKMTPRKQSSRPLERAVIMGWWVLHLLLHSDDRSFTRYV